MHYVNDNFTIFKQGLYSSPMGLYCRVFIYLHCMSRRVYLSHSDLKNPVGEGD